MNWDDCLQYVALTDIGMRRLNNQDSHVAALANDLETWKKRGHFFMVADGMGAHAAGELASRLAVEGALHRYHKYLDLSAPESLEKAIVETNAEVHRRGQANTDFHNMGTTASALVLLPQGALIAHIGDSRVYRLRRDRLQQLTRDHSLVWELREQLAEFGDLAIPKNVITRSLGPNPTVQVDIEGPFPIEVGDTFLVCSDGLTGKVADKELAAVLKTLEPEEAGRLLTDMANLRGGPDNITVIIAKVTGGDYAAGDAEPLKVGTPPPSTGLPLAIWVCFGVCFLAALVLWITGNPVPSLVAAAGAVGAVLVALLAWHRRRSVGVSLGRDRRLGRAPYTEIECPSSSASLRMLQDIASELRGNVGTGDLPLDWSEFDRLCHAAEQAGEAVSAMRGYAAAFRQLMQQIRDVQDKRAGDAGIEF